MTATSPSPTHNCSTPRRTDETETATGHIRPRQSQHHHCARQDSRRLLPFIATTSARSCRDYPLILDPYEKCGLGPSRAWLFGFLDCSGHDFRVSAEPVRLLDELAALDLKNLHPAAAFVVARGDLERRDQAAKREVVDRLEARFDVFAGRGLAAGRLKGVARRLDVERRPEDPKVVHNRVVHRTRQFP